VLPWSGWLAGYTYNGSAFTQKSVLNVAPNTQEAGIWMSGGAPSVDAAGHLYVITGNGTFDAPNSSGPTDDYGDSLLQITPGTGQNGLGVSSYFNPNYPNADLIDKDVGAGGAALVLNLTTGTAPQHLIVGGGKDGGLYVLDGDHMGGSGNTHAWQLLSLGQPIFSTAAFWNNMLYIAPVDGQLQAYAFSPGTKKFTTPAASKSATTFMFPGATPSVSASGATANGIVWAINLAQLLHASNRRLRTCGTARLRRHRRGYRAVEQHHDRRRQRGECRQVHRADHRQRQGVHRHPRQQHRRCGQLHQQGRRARCLRPEE
jgi:hypothetical protein